MMKYNEKIVRVLMFGSWIEDWVLDTGCIERWDNTKPL